MPSSRKPRCVAYVRAGWERHVWIPCMRLRQCGSLFCRRHEDAVKGAALGLCVYRSPQNADAQRNAANRTRQETKQQRS
jgi:hypothetical protein